MIRIRLDEPTLARTRIAISPINELVGGLYLLRNGPTPWPYTGWSERAREILRTVPQTAPLDLYARLRGRTPDLFEPIPPSPAPHLDDELEILRCTPRQLVGEQFAKHYPDGTPEFLLPYLSDTDRAFGRLAEAMSAFWELAFAPHWPALRATLDEEVLLRAQALAGDGPGALLAGLQGSVRWEPPVLSLVKQVESAIEAVDQRLLLVPLAFAGGVLRCTTDHPEILMVSYQARGAAVLSDATAPDRVDDRLGLLIGRGRATVLRALAQPATTTGLAGVLGLAPSTVSEHLTALRAAGVVHRRRRGRRVLYGLEPAGEALLTLLEPGTVAGGSTG